MTLVEELIHFLLMSAIASLILLHSNVCLLLADGDLDLNVVGVSRGRLLLSCTLADEPACLARAVAASLMVHLRFRM